MIVTKREAKKRLDLISAKSVIRVDITHEENFSHRREVIDIDKAKTYIDMAENIDLLQDDLIDLIILTGIIPDSLYNMIYIRGKTIC